MTYMCIDIYKITLFGIRNATDHKGSYKVVSRNYKLVYKPYVAIVGYSSFVTINPTIYLYVDINQLSSRTGARTTL